MEEFVVKDTKFSGQNNSGTALEIIDTAMWIVNSTFKFYRKGYNMWRNSLYDRNSYVGRAIIAIDCEISINQSKFISNGAKYGGAIFANHSIIVIHGSIFTNNSAEDRKVPLSWRSIITSVLYSLESTITIKLSKFDGNTVISRIGGSRNGALSSLRSTIIIETSKFDYNTVNSVSGSGGVLYSSGSNITIKVSEFNGNTVALLSEGGVLYSLENNIITIKTSKFDGNMVTSSEGGVLYSLKSNNITIETSKFDDNTINSRFGGILYSLESDITIDTSNFNCNTIISIGGRCTCVGAVLYSLESDITIKRSKFGDNNVTSKGGTSVSAVLYSLGSNMTIEQSKFDANIVKTRAGDGVGGLLYYLDSTAIITSCNFDDNTVTSRGGGSIGGVLYSLCNSITIQTSKFYGNTVNSTSGIGILGSVSGVLYSLESNIIIKEVYFNNNTVTTLGDDLEGGVLYSSESNITIETSRFDNNAVISSEGESSKSGVLRSRHCSITIVAVMFYANFANSRGGVIYSENSIITIDSESASITDAYEGGFNFEGSMNSNSAIAGTVVCTEDINVNNYLQVMNNRGRYSVIYLINSELNVKNSGNLIISYNVGSLVAFNSNITFMGCVEFVNNHPEQSKDIFQKGGAITLFQSNAFFNGNCSLQNNHAENGGGLLSTESKLYVNGNLTMSHNSATRNGGGVYLSNSELTCLWKSAFLLYNNHAGQKGGGLHAISSSIKVNSAYPRNTVTVTVPHGKPYTSLRARINFTTNEANMGGGLSLEANAKLYVLKYDNTVDVCTTTLSTMVFIANNANYGGAIYVDDDSNSGTCTSNSKIECFFQVLAVHGEKGDYLETRSIYFLRNQANISGSTLFGGLLDRCGASQFAEVRYRYYRHKSDDSYSGIAYFKYVLVSPINCISESSVASNISISSGPVKVCLCIQNEYNCSHQLLAIFEVKKGEAFDVQLVAVDQIEQPVDAIIQASLEFTESGLSEGQLTTEIPGECTNLTFNVVSPHNYENLILSALDGPCKDANLSRRVIKIDFQPCSCPIGFQISGNSDINCTCDCHSNISLHTEHCDSRTGSFIKNSHSRAWISYINDSNQTGYLVYQNCPFDYCISLSLPIDLNQPNGADTQCAFNRSSLLCGSCQPGLSISLGSSHCLQCPNHWSALLAVITLAAILAGIALVALLLILNMTVAVGSLNGVIFYANIVHANKSILLPFQDTNLVTVFISLLNLELGVDTCYFPGMDTYIKTWLQLAFPAFVFTLVGIIIIVSSHSITFSKLIGSKDPVATLATLILLSYAKLLQICFESLSVGILMYPDGTSEPLWLPDATVKYLSGKHSPLFIAAVLIILLGLIFTALLFLWQWRFCLPMWKIFTVCLRNQKLQFFIETYHAPFIPKHRYWTGLLLTSRAILYLVVAANVSNDPQLSLSAIVFTMIFILLLITFIDIRMYKKKSVNFLETFFVLNILLFAVFTWYSLSSANINQKAVAYTSVLSTFIILKFIILYHVYTYTRVFSKLKKINIHRIINKFKVGPTIRTIHNWRPPSGDNRHRFMITGTSTVTVNANDYNVPLLDRQPVEPTCSVVELPKSDPNQPIPEEANICNILDSGPGASVNADQR